MIELITDGGHLVAVLVYRANREQMRVLRMFRCGLVDDQPLARRWRCQAVLIQEAWRSYYESLGRLNRRPAGVRTTFAEVLAPKTEELVHAHD